MEKGATGAFVLVCDYYDERPKTQTPTLLVGKRRNVQMENWNPVLNKVQEVSNSVPLEVWKSQNWEKWIAAAPFHLQKLFAPIQTTQHGDLVLFRYGKYGDLFGGEQELEYGEFWDAHNGFYRECRSVVVDIRHMELATAPVKKFLNYGEGENSHAYIEHLFYTAKTVEVADKLDGSMCVASWHRGKIVVHSSKVLDPHNSWRLMDMEQLIQQNVDLASGICMFPHLTFIFEYICAADAHVVNYTKEQEGLWLIGARNKKNGEELSYAAVEKLAMLLGCKMPMLFQRDLGQILEDLRVLPADKVEGYVVNFDGHKVKFKTDDYVQLHRILGQLSSPNLVLEYVAENKLDDLMAKIPETHRPRVREIAHAIVGYAADMSKQVVRYYEIAPQTSRKDFMIWVEENVPKEIRGYVREKYLRRAYNVLKKGRGYKKASEVLDLPEEE